MLACWSFVLAILFIPASAFVSVHLGTIRIQAQQTSQAIRRQPPFRSQPWTLSSTSDEEENISSDSNEDNNKDESKDADDTSSAANNDSDSSTEELVLTDTDMSFLFSKIKMLKEADVELDSNCARNWKLGHFSHKVLLSASGDIRHVRLCNKQIALGSEQGELFIVNAESGEMLNAFVGHDTAVTAMAFTGDLLVTGSEDGTIMVHKHSPPVMEGNLDKVGECYMAVTGASLGEIRSVAILPEADVFSAIDGGGRVAIWDLKTGKRTDIPPKTVQVQGYYGTGGNMSEKDEGESYGGLRTTMYANDNFSNKGISQKGVIQIEDELLCVAAAEDFIAVGGEAGIVTCYEAKTGREVLSWNAHGESSVRCIFFDSQRRLLTGGEDGVVKYWDLIQGGAPRVGFYNVDGRFINHKFTGHEAPIIAIQADETKVVAAASDGIVRVFDLPRGFEVFRIEGFTETFTSVAFDRQYLVTDGTYKTLLVHDFSKDQETDEVYIEEA